MFFYYILLLKTLKKNFFIEVLTLKSSLICILIFISLAQHIIVTKNQIFIFFLILIFLGFAHLQIKNDVNLKKYLNYLLIIFCVLATLKYHLRFNVDRKFHELNGVQFSNAVSSAKLSKKLSGLKWISPRKNTKYETLLEVNKLSDLPFICIKFIIAPMGNRN